VRAFTRSPLISSIFLPPCHAPYQVLRFFRGGSDADAAASAGAGAGAGAGATLELHIIEDLHIDWTHHTAHVLPLARFLQDVGARRAAAAALPHSAHASAASLASAQAALWRRPEARPSTFASLLQRLMARPEATLFFRGEAVRGCEGWAFALSQQAADALLAPPPPPRRALLALHVLSSSPAPLSAQERAFTAAVRAQTRALAGGLALFEARNASLAPGRAPPPPLLPPHAPGAGARRDDTAMHAGLMVHLDVAHRALTARLRGLPLVLLAPRVGDAAVLAEEFGVDAALPPTLVLYGAEAAELRGTGVAAEEGTIFGATRVLRMDGADLTGLPRALERAWAAAAAAA
jgi:hypothetical protein